MRVFLKSYGTGGHGGAMHKILCLGAKAAGCYFYELDKNEMTIMAQPSEDDIEVQDDLLNEKKVTNGFKYERDPKLREMAIQIQGNSCKICGFNFYEKYGMIGLNFIHIHHVIPVSIQKENNFTNPEKDLIPVCANCHAMLHRMRKKVLTPEQLKNYIKDKNYAHIS